MRRALVVVTACAAIALLATPQAFASCTQITLMFHAFGWFNCFDAAKNAAGVPLTPPTAYAYQLSAPGTSNTSNLDFLCEVSADNGGPETCNNPSAGMAGDGIVTSALDWQQPGVTGCPVVSGVPQRVVLVVQASNGQGLVASMNGASPDSQYSPDLAGFVDDATRSCGDLNGRPKIVTSTVTGSTVNLGLRFDTPRVYSDCDSDSLGLAIYGACPDAGVGTPTIASIYSSLQPSMPDPDPNHQGKEICPAADATLARWTRVATPVVGGTTNIQVATPPAGQCLYVGSTMTIGGVESAGITGYVVYGNPLPASPTAENLGVGRAAGQVKVSWETRSEDGLAGFKIMAVGHKGEFQVGSFIGAKGTASKYTASLSMADFKGNKGVKVVSVLTDGTTLSSAVKNF